MAVLSSMQIPDSTIAELDAIAHRLSRRAPGAKVTRTDVIRMLLERAAPRADELLEAGPSRAQQDGLGAFLELARKIRAKAKSRRIGPKSHTWTRADAYEDDED